MTEQKPPVVCLCGSTKFYHAYQLANYQETMKGKIVLSVGFFPHSQEQVHGQEIGCTDEQKAMLDELHKRKIDLADEVLFLNVNNYMGNSTYSELAYAAEKGKQIRFLIKPTVDDGYFGDLMCDKCGYVNHHSQWIYFQNDDYPDGNRACPVAFCDGTIDDVVGLEQREIPF